MTSRIALWICLFVLACGGAAPCPACTSLLVTKGAAADGSVMITYTCDGEFHPTLQYTAAADHPEGDSLELTDWSGDVRGKIAQVSHTYTVVGLMNERQVAIGETTFDGREELVNENGLLRYWDLMQIALERAGSAREAIKVIAGLVDDYGYRSSGETFSIADPQEAWLMEIIGPGPGGTGAEWVARRIPDGYVSCHANRSRITEFPLHDPDNCLYSANVVTFAVEKGYYDPDAGRAFSFSDAYCPSTPKDLRFTDARVWSIFRRAAPSQNFSADVHRGVPGAEPYPLWIKPDKKLALADVFTLMRDHYEGTPYDMTTGVDAGPYGSPYRSRPLAWRPDKADSTGPEYAWERPISTQQTAYSFVSQSRGWLPDHVGGIYWYALDDTYTNCYVPLYCGIESVPEAFTVGNRRSFSWESAWWVFNFVANYANLKYSYMAPEIQAVQRDLEGEFLALQPAVEKTALDLAKSDPELLDRYLTDYSVTHGEQVVARWRQLGEYLIAKYNDGYVNDDKGHPQELGYPESWLRTVVHDRPGQFRVPAADTTGMPIGSIE